MAAGQNGLVTLSGESQHEGVARRISLPDLLFAAVFVSVALAVWIQSRPEPIGPLLARQAILIDQADAAKLGLPFLPPPASPEEAKDLTDQWRKFLKANGPGTWAGLQGAVAQRGKPATVAAFGQNWKVYQDAQAAFEEALAALTLPDSPSEPGIEAKHTEDYMTRYNDFKDADDALEQWVIRLSPGDFN